MNKQARTEITTVLEKHLTTVQRTYKENRNNIKYLAEQQRTLKAEIAELHRIIKTLE